MSFNDELKRNRKENEEFIYQKTLYIYIDVGKYIYVFTHITYWINIFAIQFSEIMIKMKFKGRTSYGI